MKRDLGGRLTKQEAVQRADSVCRRNGKEISQTDLLRIIMTKNKETGRPLYFWSVKVMSPRGTEAYALIDRGDFEERILAAIKHYDANKPLVIRGKEITEADLLDPGFDWKSIDEEEGET